MEIKERYCSYKVSKLLEEKGFEQYCQHSYDSKGVFKWSDNLDPYECSAPTHQMACDWIRITRNLYIDIYYDGGDKAWLFSIISIPNGTVVHTSSTKNNAPNEATEEALKFVLTKLI